MAKNKSKKEPKKEPIVVVIEKFGRVKLNYFTEGVSFAVFNTRPHLIEDAERWVLSREIKIKSDKREPLRATQIGMINASGIMSIFDTPPRLQSRTERLFMFRLIQSTDRYFAAGEHEREAEREIAAATFTADGLDARKQKSLFYIDAVDSRIVEVETKDLKFFRQGGCKRKDELNFDALSESKLGKEMFGSHLAAQLAFESHLADRIRTVKAKIVDQQAELERLLEKQSRLLIDI